MKEIFGGGGLLARHLSSFEARSGQLRMAEAVQATLSADEKVGEEGQRANVLLVEAETGIGKTLAYLIPALLSGQRVVVSTATINLQDQILNKEIPLIERVLGRSASALCVKGRQNYLCLYRWNQYRSSPQLSLVEDTNIGKIEKWLEATSSGDRAELSWLADGSPLWPKISAQSSQCLGGDCPDGAACFVNRLRKQAGSARLLIVNHHLFFSDLALRQAGFAEILPRYQAVIFDEAHHLESVATQFFGKNFSQYQLLDLVADIERQVEADLPTKSRDKISSFARGLLPRMERFALLFPAQRGRYPLADLIATHSSWPQEVEGVATGIDQLAELLAGQSSKGEVWNTLSTRSSELAANLRHICLPPERSSEDRFVHWYERRERTITLSATPVRIASELERTLYSSVQSCIMTSATLSAGGDFAYVKERLGLGPEAVTLQFHSPFDYEGRTLVYVPEKGFPEPADATYTHKVCQQVLELLQISQGRALVLFTSLKAMDVMAEFLESRISYPVLVQGRASRQALLARFKETTDSVLLAVASFWEGVDVPGNSLSCVIIDKLPFEVPSDPVIQARIQAINDGGGKPFFDFQVPRAILTLRQGVGRLMRAASDCGVIAIMDVRLFTKGYGRSFRASLPPSPVVRSLSDVRNFFEQKCDSHENSGG
ncbi:MAG: ATP-dependent DNA helicase [Desulfocapsaceae bacterium]|nr:ATP-dependent DNA helicase [Desulfocapsaceae bacterium]